MRILIFQMLMASLFFRSQASACIYFDKNLSHHEFHETDREALIFHDGDEANLIIKTGFKGKLPLSLTWVLPVPVKPSGYKVLTWDIFPRMSALFAPNSFQGRSGVTPTANLKGKLGPSGISIHKEEHVGVYEIIPIEILSDNSGGELNEWLSKQGFIQSPLSIQKPYLKKGAFFLAIRLKPTGSLLDIKPLWIRYPSEEASFPVRFTHDYRTYNLKVFLLTRLGRKFHEPRGKGWALNELNSKIFQSTSIARFANKSKVDNFESWIYLMDEFAKIPTVSAFLARKDLTLTRLSYVGVNSPTMESLLKTANLTDDPKITN